MKKLPVLATIRDAYNFTFTHLGAIIGLIWLPMILITVMGFFVLQRFFDAYAGALASGNAANLGPEALGVVSLFVAALLLFTMMTVPVMQLAMGTRKDGALVHFAFGTVEWRLFRGVMGLVGFLLVPLLVVSVLTGLMSAGVGVALNPGQAMLAVIAMYGLLFLALLYFGLRFGLLLPAVAVNESGPLLPRSWLLSADNFWRILAVFLAIFIPVELLSGIIQLAVEGPQALMMSPQSSTAMAAAQFHAAAMNMPLAAGIYFLIAPMKLGLLLGAAASIYKSLHVTVDEIA
jgi:hypothetical protein